MTYLVTKLVRQEREPAHSFVFGREFSPLAGLAATVRATDEQDPHERTLFVSRPDSLKRWQLDGVWYGTRPLFHNGSLSRLSQPIIDQALLKALDDEEQLARADGRLPRPTPEPEPAL